MRQIIEHEKINQDMFIRLMDEKYELEDEEEKLIKQYQSISYRLHIIRRKIKEIDGQIKNFWNKFRGFLTR